MSSTNGSRPRFMFSAAEVSGDALAGRLAGELRRLDPDVRLWGMGGAHMAAAGVDVEIDITDTSTFGLTDLFNSFPRHLRTLRRLRRMLADRRPDALILVDAPGFNFAVATMARRLGVRTIYYIPPQTWLWNPASAARRMRNKVDLVVAIFEREAMLYRQAGANVVYHGHPLVDLSRLSVAPREARLRHGIPEGLPCIGLFPGSRRQEIARLLPAMARAVDRIRANVGPVRVVLGVASAQLRDVVHGVLPADTPDLHVFESSAHDALACCDVSLAASGTILLEAVALDAPVVMTYKLDALTYLYGKYLLRVPQKIPYYSMPNIVANARVVPELVLEAATPERLAAEALGLLTDAGRREEMRRGFRVIRSRLGTPGVVSRVAQDILEFLAPSPQAVGAAERAGALFERARRAERHS